MTVVQLNQQAVAVSPAANGPRIWAVASGKGGVGKSFIASSLGLALSRHGKRVVLVDLDLGGANLHTCLGIHNPDRTLSDFISGKHKNINDIVQTIPDTTLGLVSGASDGLEIANIKHFQKQKVIRNLKQIDADYVILDLGAGTAFNTLDFFIQAEKGIISVLPDPTSIENTYRFLKCMLTRRLRDAPRQTRKLMSQVLSMRHGENRKIRTLASFMAAMEQLHPDHARLLRGELEKQKLHLIVNQVQEPADTELGPSMSTACSKYFGQKLYYLGHLNNDRQIVSALKQRRPFLLAFPQSRAAINLEHMAAALLDQDTQSFSAC
jgi:flagellar biosynthesis protein FlhG